MSTTVDLHKRLLRELIVLCRKNLPGFREELIEKAFDFAAVAHENDKRASDDPYITHPFQVAKILASEIPFDDTSVASALLHDVLEDNENYDLETIRKNFGKEIAVIVDGLTKIKNIFKGSEFDQSENYRKLLMSVTKDVRVIIVKFADRLNNMRTIGYLQQDKRKKIAKETLEVYAPLAHRFGLGKLKWELEDLAFKELNTQAYDDIKKKINAKRHEREQFIDQFTQPIIEKLKPYNYRYEISGRAKHLYSIYRKMIKRNKPFEELFDLFAIRLILDTDDQNQCYTVYGVVNSIYHPVADRFKDYIAIPKSNNYQSIHTTVMGPLGRPVEVQIRTRQMHEIAEEGVAAHWRYKEGKSGTDATIDRYVNWIRELLETSGTDDLRKSIIENFKLNLYQDEIYVFTPKGELKRLPLESTPVDFAFAVHSKVGHHCIGAKVNNRIVPLDTRLNSGDQVEIITSKNQHPNKNWLKFVKTNKARADIRKWINKEEEDLIQLGKEAWEKKLKKSKLSLSPDDLLKIIHGLKVENHRQFFKAIGSGKLNVDEIINATQDERDRKAKDINTEIASFTRYARNTGGEVIVGGSFSGMMVTYAKCCNPIPGDPVVGYITTLEGIKIHRRNCRNIIDISMRDPEKIIAVNWPEAESSSFIAGLMLRGEDSPGLLNEVANSIVTYQNTNIKSISIDTSDNHFEGTVTLYVRDLDHLSRIIERLKKIKGVFSVLRMDSSA